MSNVQSVTRALGLLRAVADRPGGLVELAGRVELATSTTQRLLATLEHEGAVRRRPDGRYVLGPMIDAIRGASDSVQALEPVVRPYLEELAGVLDEAACLALVQGADVVTVQQVDAPKPVRAEDWTGTRVPLHAGSAGLVAMATWPDEEVRAYLSGDLERCTAKTIVDPPALLARINQARATGVLWSHGEYVEGLSCASAALIDSSGRAVGALYSYGPSYRYPAAGEADRIAALVRDRAEVISAQLGHAPAARSAS